MTIEISVRIDCSNCIFMMTWMWCSGLIIISGEDRWKYPQCQCEMATSYRCTWEFTWMINWTGLITLQRHARKVGADAICWGSSGSFSDFLSVTLWWHQPFSVVVVSWSSSISAAGRRRLDELMIVTPADHYHSTGQLLQWWTDTHPKWVKERYRRSCLLLSDFTTSTAPVDLTLHCATHDYYTWLSFLLSYLLLVNNKITSTLFIITFSYCTILYLCVYASLFYCLFLTIIIVYCHVASLLASVAKKPSRLQDK